LVGDRGDRLVPRPELHTRDGERRLLDHDRRRPSARGERAEGWAFERERKGVADGGGHVAQRLCRGGGSQDGVAVSRLRNDDSRVCEQRDSRHVVRRAAAAETPSAMKIPPETYRRTRATAAVRRSRPARASAATA